jgi:ribosomal protein L34E
VRGAVSSRETVGSRGQRATSDQCAKWMNDSARRRFWTTPPVIAATSHVKRTQSDHHSGTGVSTVSGVGAIAPDATTARRATGRRPQPTAGARRIAATRARQ